MSDFLLPNSYQFPNAYCDRLMYLLTPSEWKVLSYAVRRIFGFQKFQDRISLSQFTHGTVSTKDGRTLDHGTGLSKPTVITCLDTLIKYRLIVKLDDNDPAKKEGDLYSLQLDYDMVDYIGLVERANKRASADLDRTSAGRNSAASKRLSLPLIGQSDLPINEKSSVNGIDRYWSMGLTGTGQSDLPQPVNGIDTQYQEETKNEIQVGIYHPDFIAACARLKAADPVSYDQAAPLLLETDEKPYRLHIRLSSVPPGFMDAIKAALHDANPRRHYQITYQTSGTGRAAERQEITPPEVNPYAPNDEQLLLWTEIISDLSVDVKPNTFKAYINPARVVSVNGNWTVEVPSVTWWESHMSASLRRIYKKLTGESTEFVFVEIQ